MGSRGESLAIRAERDAPDEPRVPFEDQQALPAARVPQPDGLVRTRRGEPAIGAECEAVDRVDMPAQDASEPVAASHSRIEWSSADVATVRPSGLNATALIRPPAPRSVTRAGKVPEIKWSKLADARVGRRGLSPGRESHPSDLEVRTGRPRLRVHAWIVRSWPPENMVLPSGVKTSPRTAPLCSVKVSRANPFASQPPRTRPWRPWSFFFFFFFFFWCGCLRMPMTAVPSRGSVPPGRPPSCFGRARAIDSGTS